LGSLDAPFPPRSSLLSCLLNNGTLKYFLITARESNRNPVKLASGKFNFSHSVIEKDHFERR
jgi:hypothetical protein